MPRSACRSRSTPWCSQPRTGGAECADLPQGPAFRMVLQGKDGTIRTYANEGLACNGWPALASYYVALAEQAPTQALGPARRATASSGARRSSARRVAPPGVAPPSLPRGTVLTTATACLHPRPMLTTRSRGTAPSGPTSWAPRSSPSSTPTWPRRGRARRPAARARPATRSSWCGAKTDDGPPRRAQQRLRRPVHRRLEGAGHLAGQRRDPGHAPGPAGRGRLSDGRPPSHRLPRRRTRRELSRR